MKITELMQTNVITGKPEDSLAMASRKFKDQGFRHLPVVDDENKLLGVFTDRDLKRASASGATLLEVHELLYLMDQVKLSEVMTKNPITITGEDPLQKAAQLMVEKKVGCLPVITGEKLIGIITEIDLLRYLAQST